MINNSTNAKVQGTEVSVIGTLVIVENDKSIYKRYDDFSKKINDVEWERFYLNIMVADYKTMVAYYSNVYKGMKFNIDDTFTFCEKTNTYYLNALWYGDEENINEANMVSLQLPASWHVEGININEI